MRTDKFSIGGLIGVHVSSIVNEVVRTINANQTKTNQFSLREKLFPLLFFVRLILFWWLVLVWFAFLYARNLFVKQNKLVCNCPNNLIYYTTPRITKDWMLRFWFKKIVQELYKDEEGGEKANLGKQAYIGKMLICR